ncbi:MAG TPA: VOC family protein [Solirubrobacteraceae bacterium]|jgi:catechol 2,3-dioxygenase-like lactoylglutathione lyase family enzyme
MPIRNVVIDHVTIGVSDLATSAEFYRRVLATLGFRDFGPWQEGDPDLAFGTDGADDFAISLNYPTGAPVHIAFAAERRQQVDAFHAAGLAAGGTDNGAPGFRPEYSDGYYGAFILDPDGNNIEAVHHADD